MKEREIETARDLELLEAFKATGDNRYFQEIFQRYSNRIRMACLRFFRGNLALAEDAAQETFRKAFEKFHDCATENVGGWLFTIAKNSCIDLHRRQGTVLDAAATNSDTPLAGRKTLYEQERRLHLDELIRQINQLSERQRISFKLYLEGYSYKEIHQITGYTEKEVKASIQGAKENLKKALSEKEGELEL